MRRTATALLAAGLLLAAFAGVALAAVERGTGGTDVIRGTDRPDELYGKGGDDLVSGREGDDRVYGGGGNDDLFGRADEDRIRGASGTDDMDGGPGSDVLYGEGGGDYLADGPLAEGSVDVLHGGGGDDVFLTKNRPANRDVVRCGPGADTVEADTKDRVSSDCEKLDRR